MKIIARGKSYFGLRRKSSKIRGAGQAMSWQTRESGESLRGGGGWTQAKRYYKSSIFFFADPCELACFSGPVLTWHGLVADGHRCTNRPDIFDVCIAGKCRVRKNSHGVPKEIRVAFDERRIFLVHKLAVKLVRNETHDRSVKC